MRRLIGAMLVVLALTGCGGGGAGGVRKDGAVGAAEGSGSPGPSPSDGVRTAGCATATATPAMSIDGTPQPANQEALGEVADRIRPRAEKEFAAVFGDVRMVQERDRLQVFRKPSPAFDRWLLRDFAADCVEMLDAKYSAIELASYQDRVQADADHWRQRGIRINTIGADVIRGAIVVGTLDVERARRELPARYGPEAPIEVERQEPVTLW